MIKFDRFRVILCFLEDSLNVADIDHNILDQCTP